MIIRPCKFDVTCPGTDEPVSNYSSESNDTLDFLSRQFFGNSPPPFLRNWNANGCGQTFISNISQADAQLQAAQAAALCADNGPCVGAGCPPVGGGATFCNDAEVVCLPCPDGTQFCYTVQAGAFCGFPNKARANSYAHGQAFSLAQQRRFCLSSFNVSGCVGQPYSQSVNVTGPVITPCTWTIVAGALPPGLALGGFSPNIDTTLSPTETIKGTPTQGGNFTFTLQCQGADFSSMQKTYTICITSIGPSVLPNATLSTPYSAQLSDAGTCFSGPTWTISAGSLPSGLSINATSGLISGIPSQSGTFNFTVTETSGASSCSQAFTLTVAGASCPNQVTVQNVAGIFTNPCPGQLNSVPGFFLWNGILVLANPNCNSAGCGVGGVIYLTTGVPQRFPGANNSEISDAVLLRPKSDLSAWTCMIGIGAGHGTQISISGTGWGLVIGGMALDGATGIRVWSGSNGSTSPTGVFNSDGLGCVATGQVTLM